MHPLLENLSMFTWMDIIGSDEKCISFLEDFELIPKRTINASGCPKCSGPTVPHSHPSYSLGWRWVCKKRKSKEDRCCGVKNPLEGTFFENLHLPLKEVLALIFGYIMQKSVAAIEDHINCWRRNLKKKVISSSTISDFYCRFKGIIFNTLRQRGDFTENLENADRKEILGKYIKTMGMKPFFRNIVFQLLVDMKSIYPCAKTEVVCENVASSVPFSTPSLDDTNLSTPPSNENTSNLTTLTNVPDASISSCSSAENTNVENVKTQNIVSVSSNSHTPVKNSHDAIERLKGSNSANPVKVRILNENNLDVSTALNTSHSDVENITVGSASPQNEATLSASTFTEHSNLSNTVYFSEVSTPRDLENMDIEEIISSNDDSLSINLPVFATVASYMEVGESVSSVTDET